MGKIWLLTLIICSLVLNPLASFANNPPRAIKEEDYGKYFNPVSQLILDFSEIKDNANTLTADQPEKVYLIFVNAFSLLDEVVKDTSLSAEKQSKIVGKIVSEVARATFKYIRHDADQKNPDGRTTATDKILGMFNEIGSDVVSLFTFRSSTQGQTTWAPAEAARREKLVRNLIGMYQTEFDDLSVRVNTKDAIVQEFFYGPMHFMVDRSVNLRAERDSAQYMARMFYFFSGVFLFLNPIVDYATEVTYYSTFNSGLINLTILSFFWFVKGLTSSRDSSKLWVSFLDKLMKAKDPKLTEQLRAQLQERFPGEYNEPYIQKTLRFEMALRTKLIASKIYTDYIINFKATLARGLEITKDFLWEEGTPVKSPTKKPTSATVTGATCEAIFAR